MIRHMAFAGAMGLVSLTALLTWYWANGLHTSAPYPAPYFWCGPESVPLREEFARECMATIQPATMSKVDMVGWCDQLSAGIYCRHEEGFRYSRIAGGMAEQTPVMPCRGAISDAERVVCGKVVR